MEVTVVGVPFNSAGLTGGVARAPAALRRAGLVSGLARRLDVADAGDVGFDPPAPERSPTSGLLAEPALVSMVAGTRQAVAAVHQAGRFPLVVGGDCPVMLGALAATRDRHGGVGLLMLDGHEDAYPPRRSPTGEAADSELALALGLAEGLPDGLAALVPLLAPGQVGLLGPRDDATIAREGVASLRGVVPLWSDVELAVRGAAEVAAQAARDVAAAAPAWWLHVDLDVLATAELAAVDYPQPGGLRWWQLRQMTVAALAVPGCAGWTVAIYNPDLDPDGGQAARIAEYVAGAAARLAEPPDA
ncbi:MAG TPA: arginase family protein [Actinomycetota bacterium]|nr:arginase family protein [Actinomycetota bacterium]